MLVELDQRQHIGTYCSANPMILYKISFFRNNSNFELRSIFNLLSSSHYQNSFSYIERKCSVNKTTGNITEFAAQHVLV